jgi:hypothetical protein
MRILQVLALLAAVSASACGRENRMPHVKTRLAPNEFISVMVELGKSQPHQRDIILKKHHTSDAEIREFVDKYARYPTALSNTFDTIQARIQRPDRPRRTR